MVELDGAWNRAARVNARADLRDIRLFNVEANLNVVPSSPIELTYSFNGTIQVQSVEETSALIVDGNYLLRVIALDEAAATDGSDEPPGEEILHLSFKLAAHFSLEEPDTEPKQFSDDELDSFGETTGRLALHPYAREFVADITGRMGLPSLHIATLKIPIDKQNADADH